MLEWLEFRELEIRILILVLIENQKDDIMQFYDRLRDLPDRISKLWDAILFYLFRVSRDSAFAVEMRIDHEIKNPGTIDFQGRKFFRFAYAFVDHSSSRHELSFHPEASFYGPYVFVVLHDLLHDEPFFLPHSAPIYLLVFRFTEILPLPFWYESSFASPEL